MKACEDAIMIESDGVDVQISIILWVYYACKHYILFKNRLINSMILHITVWYPPTPYESQELKPLI